MVTIRQKTHATLSMHAACATHARTELAIRDLHSVIDEPVERGGTNQGPTPTETLLAALVGCTNVIGHRVAEAAGVAFQSMTIDAEADFDRHGVLLEDEVEVPFPAVRLAINVTTDADDDALETVKRDLDKYCPLSKVVRNCGTDLQVTWNVTRP